MYSRQVRLGLAYSASTWRWPHSATIFVVLVESRAGQSARTTTPACSPPVTARVWIIRSVSRLRARNEHRWPAPDAGHVHRSLGQTERAAVSRPFGAPTVDQGAADVRRKMAKGEAWLHGIFPDVFDPEFQKIAYDIAAQKCAPNKDKPWILGWFTDNELRGAPTGAVRMNC